ncbi:HTH_48 domain-containing protein [Trichonephila clavipes]|nr:HTH_48 domain-containing protein [Trichonephila clavipes]
MKAILRESHSTRIPDTVATCYKIASFGTEYYEETTVVPVQSKLETTARINKGAAMLNGLPHFNDCEERRGNRFPQVSRTLLLEFVTQKLGYRKFCARWLPKLLTDRHKGQRMGAALTFLEACGRLAHNATETFAKLQQAYGDSVLSMAQIFRWFKASSEGRESIEDEPRSGRPSVSKAAENVGRVRDLVRSDHRRLTVRLIGGRVEFESHHRSSDFDQ